MDEEAEVYTHLSQTSSRGRVRCWTQTDWPPIPKLWCTKLYSFSICDCRIERHPQEVRTCVWVLLYWWWFAVWIKSNLAFSLISFSFLFCIPNHSPIPSPCPVFAIRIFMKSNNNSLRWWWSWSTSLILFLVILSFLSISLLLLTNFSFQGSIRTWFVFFFFLKFIYFYWSIVDLQCCVNFRCTAKWFSYIYIYFFFPARFFLCFQKYYM